MAKEITLTEAQRIHIEQFCDSQGGPRAITRKWDKISQAVALPDDRKKEIGLLMGPNGSYSWNPRYECAETVTITLEDAQCEMLKDKLVPHVWPDSPGIVPWLRGWFDGVVDQL